MKARGIAAARAAFAAPGAAFAAPGAALVVVLLSRSALAITITMEPAAPVTIGQSQTFRVATVADAIGDVTFTWIFGDGTMSGPAPEQQVTHTYQLAGHYTVIVLGSDGTTRTSASFVQTAHHPLTPNPPSHSSSIIVDGRHHQVWNVNPDNDTVSVIDTESLTRLREIPVGKEPRSLAQAPDGSIWVANQMSDEIVVLHRETGAVQARIRLPHASQPRSLAVAPSGSAYVSLFATGKLVEIDTVSRQVTREVALGPTPAGISVAADGRVFVTRFISPDDHGEIWVVSPRTLALTNTIRLAYDQSPDTESSGRGVPNHVASLSISPDGTQGWVTAKKDDTARGLLRDGQPTTSDNFVRAIVCVIDMTTEQEILAKREDIDNRSLPVQVVFSPVGDYAYILALASNWIGITDAYSGLSLSGIRQVGNAPDGLVLAPNGRLFVNAFLSREVMVYDLRPSLGSVDHQAPEPLARIRAVDREALPPDVLLGKQIFFNAADTRMSNDGYLSCASCHLAGLSDGRVWDFSGRGEGLRNTKSLLGARGAAGDGRVHWSANFDEIQDFERDIRDDFEGSGFMADAEYNARKGPTGAYDPFARASAGVSVELDALAAYLTSLDKVSRSPHRNPDGTFTEAALAGRKIFTRAGCPECHSGPNFTDSASGILHDVGTLLPTSGERLGEALTGIDTPSLKGIWQSAPYYHDGRASTLMEIFTTYNPDDRMGKTSDLTAVELEQLVAYLQQLDDVPVTPTPDDKRPAAQGCCAVGGSTPGDRPRELLACLMAAAAALAVSRKRRPGRRRRDGSDLRGASMLRDGSGLK